MSFDSYQNPPRTPGFQGAVKWIVIVSGLMLIVEQFAGLTIIPLLGLVPSQVVERLWLWQPLTYLFLHLGFLHWLFNMLAVWYIGSDLERRWGTAEFLRYFFLTGTAAAGFVLLLFPHMDKPIVGCSGAVFGLLVAFAMLYPNATMYVYWLFPLKIWHACAIFALIELFGTDSWATRVAHLSGMAIGFVYLRFSGVLSIRLKSWFPKRITRRRPIEFHEISDDLVVQVDRILDKVLKQGVESLTPDEKEIMDRYTKSKH